LNGLFDGRLLVVYSGNSVGDGGSDKVVSGGVGTLFDMFVGLSLWFEQREAACWRVEVKREKLRNGDAFLRAV
jgi:hypothetical protein